MSTTIASVWVKSTSTTISSLIREVTVLFFFSRLIVFVRTNNCATEILVGMILNASHDHRKMTAIRQWQHFDYFTILSQSNFAAVFHSNSSLIRYISRIHTRWYSLFCICFGYIERNVMVFDAFFFLENLKKEILFYFLYIFHYFKIKIATICIIN